jgi:SOS-response transcriptional repressor LexA
VDTDGTAHYTDAKQLSMRLRDAYRVDGPYPNPVQSRATIDVAVRNDQRVRVTAFDLLGRRVKTVFRDKISSQTTRTVPVPTDDLGSGVYFLRIEGDQFATTRKMTVIE